VDPRAILNININQLSDNEWMDIIKTIEVELHEEEETQGNLCNHIYFNA